MLVRIMRTHTPVQHVRVGEGVLNRLCLASKNQIKGAEFICIYQISMKNDRSIITRWLFKFIFLKSYSEFEEVVLHQVFLAGYFIEM